MQLKVLHIISGRYVLADGSEHEEMQGRNQRDMMTPPLEEEPGTSRIGL